MLSIGSILRPVQEYGVGPGQVLHLLGYFIPVTLTFVLPMSALFACALVYGRFSGDNELDACRASGVSLGTLVYPGLVLAVIVAIANLVLSFHVMPAFVKRAEKSLKTDAKLIFFRNIERQGFYQPPGTSSLIYADAVDSSTNMLGGVVIAEVDGPGVSRVITAEKAKIEFSPHKRFNRVQFTAYNIHKMSTEVEGGFSARKLPLSREFGTMMEDEIKFKNIEEMKEIRRDPMTFEPVASLARQIYAQFMVELLAKDIRVKLANNEGGYYDFISEPDSLRLRADEVLIGETESVNLMGNVKIIEYNGSTGEVSGTLNANKATLTIEGDRLAPTLTMELYNPTWKRADGSDGIATHRVIRGIIPPASVTKKLEGEDILSSINQERIKEELGVEASPTLRKLNAYLQKEMSQTMIDLTAEIHWRLVFGIGCVGMIMIATALGIKLRGGHLLTAFGVSAIPAGLLIVAIMAGKNIAKNSASDVSSGLLLMWGGLVFLYLGALILYRKLLKN
jgi:lipopolysaccharide export LptBFGC system permease protein LptF